MRKQCQRPDCAEPASVAYHFDAARQIVILDNLRGSLGADAGALCARHGATMVLPRGWWLDDRRQAIPTLFANLKKDLQERPTRARRAARTGHIAQRGTPGPAAEPMVSPDGGPFAPSDPDLSGGETRRFALVAPETVAVPASVPAPLILEPSEAPTASVEALDGESDLPLWTPDFDEDDDLGGLLDAKSPLLARAFAGQNRGRKKPI